ncbi:CREB/ATF bZIP transcription factor [Eucyclogobius newberryi]|uniref:CREB/ATF bZIP transcription factor n=1 Tax=Eucyclogobius newberryi TaxID=166745 RepID=UPI003B5A2B83
MITRRQGRMQSEERLEAGLEEVEVFHAQEPHALDDLDTSALELDQLLGDFTWTLDGDAASPLFDSELDDLAAYGSERDSAHEVSSASSPERRGQRARKSDHDHDHGLNKNAIAARLNRIKKKEYVSSLERKVAALASENSALKRSTCELSKRVVELEGETRYLRAVLANESTLAQLLARLGGLSGMKLSSSLFQGAAHSPGDHDYALPRKRARPEEKGEAGGVCLHVDRDHVSVEFCAACSERASAALHAQEQVL